MKSRIHLSRNGPARKITKRRPMATKQVTWDWVLVEHYAIAEFLTNRNFQPGQFVVVPVDNIGSVLIVYVKEEK